MRAGPGAEARRKQRQGGSCANDALAAGLPAPFARAPPTALVRRVGARPWVSRTAYRQFSCPNARMKMGEAVSEVHAGGESRWTPGLSLRRRPKEDVGSVPSQGRPAQRV